MPFSMEIVANEYVNKRFPNASIAEKKKIVNDWINKVPNSNILVNDFKERIGNPAGKKILDAGSGNGGTSIAFAMAGAEVSGVEIEDDLYQISQEHAKSYGLNINFILYEGVRMPFPDSYFNSAVSASVLEHTDDPTFYLQEILRTIKPQGMLYLGFPNKLWLKETHTGLWLLTYMPDFLKRIYIKLFKRNPLLENNLHFYSYFDLLKITKNCHNNGYRWQMVQEEGKSNNFFKKKLRSVLKFLGVPYKSLLPHILVILKKQKKWLVSLYLYLLKIGRTF